MLVRFFLNLMRLKPSSRRKKAVHLVTGSHGEDEALKYLQKKGFTFLERNWRSHPYEIDLICEHEDTLVFIEVKTRTNPDLDLAISAFHRQKQTHIVQGAKKYIMEKNAWERMCRFDLVCVFLENKHVEHFENVIELQNI